MIKSNAIANTLLMFAPLILMVLVVVAMSPVLSVSIVGISYVVGLTMLTKSKLNLYRQLIWFSFGPGKLDVENRQRYFRAYAIIVCGVLLNLASITLIQY